MHRWGKHICRAALPLALLLTGCGTAGPSAAADVPSAPTVAPTAPPSAAPTAVPTPTPEPTPSPTPMPPPPPAALFNWHGSAVGPEDRDVLFRTMAQAGLSVLYQHISSETTAAETAAFLAAAQQAGIEVWLLAGDPCWGLDPEGGHMLEEVARAAAFNSGLPPEQQLRGILMDTEPYLTDEWDDDPDGVMDAYVQGMTAAHAAAAEKGLSFIACIPFYYDNMGQEEGLARLLADGCDAVAIMNYSKYKEVEQIETEVALAGEKPIIVVYELQEPGTHGLQESNTYYHDGLSAVWRSMDTLRQAFGKNFACALHDYTSVREVLERE